LALDQIAFALPLNVVSDPIPATGGYAIVRVLEKKAFDPVAFEKEKSGFAATLRDTRRDQLFQAYLKQAKQRFTVEKHAEVFRRLVG
jgi:parvulin-like peptidyl-prolyl isomerase